MYKLITCFFIVLMATSCSCSKKATETAKKETNTAMEDVKKMVTDGYTSGIIEYSDKEGDCEYTIKLEDGRYFESTSIDPKFLENGTKVWFKFRGLRRVSQCPKANPVEITEMILRK